MGSLSQPLAKRRNAAQSHLETSASLGGHAGAGDGRPGGGASRGPGAGEDTTRGCGPAGHQVPPHSCAQRSPGSRPKGALEQYLWKVTPPQVSQDASDEQHPASAATRASGTSAAQAQAIPREEPQWFLFSPVNRGSPLLFQISE